jgi:PGF-pre-PGF domain-containing protein
MKYKAIIAMFVLLALVSVNAANADDGDVTTITLLDTNSNGKIDEVHITVDYSFGTAVQIDHAVGIEETISKFTVTNSTDGVLTIDTIEFVSGDATTAVFKLVLNESDPGLSYDTSATAISVAYDGSEDDLKITQAEGANPINVGSFSGLPNTDEAGPVIVSARTLTTTTFEIVFSEVVDFSTIADDELEFENLATTGYASIASADLNPDANSATYIITVTDAFGVDEDDATVRFSGAGVINDLVGNSNTQTAAVTIADGVAPTVTGLTVDLLVVSVSDDTIEVVVTFSEVMNNAVVPVITFSAGTWSLVGPGVWSVGDTVYTQSFTITDAVVASDVDVIVNGGVDLAGNVMSQHTAADEFDIDTVPPDVSGISISPSSGFVKVGDSVTVTITADSAGYSAGTILVNGEAATGFTDNTDNTYTVTYTVVEGDTDVDHGELDVSVVLEDGAGNENTPFTLVSMNTLAVDANTPAGYSVSFNMAFVNADNIESVSFTFAGAEVGTVYAYVITSTGGGDPVTDSGSITEADEQIDSIDVSGLDDGILTLSVTLTDAAGNVGVAAEDTSTKNTVAPSGYSVTFDDLFINAANDDSASFTFEDAVVGTTYHYIISSDAGAGNVTGTGVIATATDPISGIDVSSLTDGTLTLSVYLVDDEENHGLIVNATIVKDTIPPVISAVSPAEDGVIGNLVETSVLAYTLSEDVDTMVITFTRTGGEDDGDSPHTCTLTGDYLLEGSYLGINTTDACVEEAIELVEGAIYTISFDATDLYENEAVQVLSENVLADLTSPEFVEITMFSNNANNATATSGNTVWVVFETDEDIETPVVTIWNRAATVAGSGMEWNASIVMASGDPDGVLTFNISIADFAGNPASANETTDDTQVTFTKPVTPPSGGGGGGGGGSSSGPSGIGVASQVSQGKVNFSRAGIWYWTGIRPNEQNVLNTSAQNMSVKQIRVNARKNIKNLEVRMGEFAPGIEPTSVKPRGQVFKYLEVTANQDISDSIDSITFQFTVPLEWIEFQGATPDDVKLYRYFAQNWVVLQTRYLRQDGREAYYEAVTPGLSYFAITSGLDTMAAPAAGDDAPVFEPPVVDERPIAEEEAPPVAVPEKTPRKGMGLWGWFGIFVLIIALVVAGLFFLTDRNKSEYEKFKEEIEAESRVADEHPPKRKRKK